MENYNNDNTQTVGGLMDCFGRVSPYRHIVPVDEVPGELERFRMVGTLSFTLPKPSPYQMRVVRFLSDFADNIMRAGNRTDGEYSILAAIDPDKAGRLLSGKRTPLDGDVALFWQTVRNMAGWRIRAAFKTCTRVYRIIIVRETAVKDEMPQIELTCAFTRFRREILEWMEKRTEERL